MGVANMCKSCKNTDDKIKRLENIEERRIKNKIYRENNVERLRLQSKRTYQKNKERWRKRRSEYARIYSKNKKATCPSYKLKKILRDRLYSALKGVQKSQKTLDLLGCSVGELKVHLEKQFKPGMNWDNWSTNGWHVDHIRPCASFDLMRPEEQTKCFHYSNLQPLWANDNRSKSDKYTPNAESNSIEIPPQKTEIPPPEPQKNILL